MDTNWEEPGDDDKLLLREEVFQIVGCAIDILNALGHGLIEKPYENALVVEFGLRKIPFRQQPPFDVLYKGKKIGLFIPDFITFDAIVVDTKVIDQILTMNVG
jgi:GxxExxY protein